ncbi:hypothetical protein [Sciscionella marina]|uniref:hypothetical protein n=1 Tax=Sciscionella marina TaxID=508770 RepID=UPI0003A7AA16|nr:hypothetical protein [Sciscionella marina]
MTRRSDGPEDVDAAFAEIVADLEREGVGENLTAEPSEPEPSEPETTGPGVAEEQRPRPEPEPRPHASEWRTAEREWDPDADLDIDSDTEHYEPPEPPPVPRPHAATIVALVLIAIAILLFAAPNLLGISSSAAIPLGAVAAVGAAGLLLFRLRSGPPPGTPGSDDDGARL